MCVFPAFYEAIHYAFAYEYAQRFRLTVREINLHLPAISNMDIAFEQ